MTSDNDDGHEDSSATVERRNGIRSPPSLFASPASAPLASASPSTLHASLGSHSSSAELALMSEPPHLWPAEPAEALQAASTSAARYPSFALHVLHELHHVDGSDKR